MITFALFAFALCLTPAQANDTMASISGGNITFEKTRDISMDTERLEVSVDKVRVEYQFRNSSSRNIEGLISFPLSRIDSASPYRINVGEWLKAKDPIQFIVRSQGEVVPTEIKTHREVRGGSADNPEEFYDLDVHYLWKQRFPAGQVIDVTHEYSPVMGSGGDLTFSEEDKKRYCIDAAFLKAFEQLKARLQRTLSSTKLRQKDFGLGTYMHYNSFVRFSYILKTANNWSGPIRKFKLVIKKNHPSTLISVCWNGLKKTSALQFESEKENFSPQSDLEVLFVEDKRDPAFE